MVQDKAAFLAPTAVFGYGWRVGQAEASLYGGHVQNPKELQDLQKDVASLKRHLETLEERELEAMEAAENAEKDFAAAEADLERFIAGVNELVTTDLSDNERQALVSFWTILSASLAKAIYRPSLLTE